MISEHRRRLNAEYSRAYRQRNREKIQAKRKKRLAPERAECDRAMIDAIREALKLKPLYGRDIDKSSPIYSEIHRDGKMVRFEIGER